jgi:hypothetical protein
MFMLRSGQRAAFGGRAVGRRNRGPFPSDQRMVVWKRKISRCPSSPIKRAVPLRSDHPRIEDAVVQIQGYLLIPCDIPFADKFARVVQ